MIKNTNTVTFNTILMPERETPKAWCVLGGTYLPKSLVTINEDTLEMSLRDNGKRGPFVVWHVEVTMPEWLAKR
jgi:hypothetical protein